MATNYRRVTYEDRCQIHAFLQAKIPIPTISKRLGFHKSTIYKELSRNVGRFNYDPVRASRLSEQRFSHCRRSYIIQGSLESQVRKLLQRQWSPEQIAGRLHLEGQQGPSHEAIYQYVYRNWAELKYCLRRFNKRGAGRYRMRNYRRSTRKLMICSRPAKANLRLRIGDWERDTMRNQKGQHVLVCTDRKSRYTRIAKLPSRSNHKVSRATIRILKGKKVHTMTNDNGPEFRNSTELKYPVFYCEPRKPQQRGTVENTVGLLRQYLPRRSDMGSLTTRQIRRLEDRLNFRPRRCLDFRTPHEVFYGKSVALAT